MGVGSLGVGHRNGCEKNRWGNYLPALRGHPEAKVGDPVVLWGQSLPVEIIATTSADPSKASRISG